MPLVVLAAALTGGCGASVQALDAADRAGLHAHVQQVRAAAAADDPAAARAAIAEFRAHVRRLLAAGEIDPADADALLARAAAVAAGLPAPTAAPAEEPAPEPEARSGARPQATPHKDVRRQEARTPDDAERALRALRDRLARDLADWHDRKVKGKDRKHHGGWKHHDDG